MADRRADHGTEHGDGDGPASVIVGPGPGGSTRRDRWLFSEWHRASLSNAFTVAAVTAVWALIENGKNAYVVQLVLWAAFAPAYVGLSWTLFRLADAREIQAWATARHRPLTGRIRRLLFGAGATSPLWMMGLGSVYGLVAAGLVLPRAEEIAPAAGGLLIFLGFLTIVVSWVTIHTAYVLHYAYLYYRPGGGGLDFPGGRPPDFVDFAYFSYGVGKTFGATDVTVTTRAMRRTVLTHALFAFIYNSAILAVALTYVTSP